MDTQALHRLCWEAWWLPWLWVLALSVVVSGVCAALGMLLRVGGGERLMDTGPWPRGPGLSTCTWRATEVNMSLHGPVKPHVTSMKTLELTCELNT